MIEKIILGLILFNMLPKVRIVSDHKGLRITIQRVFFHSFPDTIEEGFYKGVIQLWLKKNNDWWDDLKKE